MVSATLSAQNQLSDCIQANVSTAATALGRESSYYFRYPGKKSDGELALNQCGHPKGGSGVGWSEPHNPSRYERGCGINKASQAAL